MIESRAVSLANPAARMAELHAPNLRIWRNDPFARDHFDSRELDDTLDAIATGRAAAPPVHK